MSLPDREVLGEAILGAKSAIADDLRKKMALSKSEREARYKSACLTSDRKDASVRDRTSRIFKFG